MMQPLKYIIILSILSICSYLIFRSNLVHFRVPYKSGKVRKAPLVAPRHDAEPLGASTRPTLALCLITKDDLDLLEWLEYHKAIGVTNVIIFENNSSRSSLNDIMDHFRSGFVLNYEYFMQKRKPNNQLYAYSACLKNYGADFTHIGFIDTDEYIVIRNKSQSIIDVLEPYKNYGGFTLNWKMYGSSGHVKRPKGGVLANYKHCKKNFHIKSIVNTKYAIDIGGNPHDFRYAKGFFPVDTNFKRVDGPFNPEPVPRNGSNERDFVAPPESLFDVAYINHYTLRSLEDYVRKAARGSNDLNIYDVPFFHAMDAGLKEPCEILDMPKPM